jgi:DNA mismatch repair protein MutL
MQDGRLTFSTSGTGDLADVLVEVLGIETMRAMLPVNPVEPSRPDLPPITVYGYTSAPQLNRNTRSHITLFVNGRHIQDASLAHAVCQAYHTMMHSDRYPICVLMISMPPEDVDVNVHPAKAEVRFRSPDAVFSAVQRAVRHAVVAQAPVPSVSVRAFNDDDQESDAQVASSYPEAPAAVATRTYGESQLDFDLPTYDPGRRSQQIAPSFQLPQAQSPLTSSARTDYSPPVSVQPSADLMQRPRTLPPLRVVGQIGATYIVAEGPAGMYLVDQHAAHERILYEQYMLERTNKPVIAQQTLDSVAIELSPAAAQLIEENLDALNTIGFAIEPFGTNTFLVRAVPAIFANRLPQEAIGVILDDLEIGAEPGESTLEAQIVLRICKVAAIRAGQTLSYDEMQTLLRQLERCSSPRTCPHGRPTMIHMTAEQLAKEFGRT